jgi:hypothetical protein
MLIDHNNLLNDLNDWAKPIFTDFLWQIQNHLYCDLIITGVYYTYSNSLLLHQQNPLNPIFNFHEFGISVDLNAMKDNRTFHKLDSVADWESTKIPALARKLNIRWGGSFSNYHDPVHFDLAGRFNMNVFELIAKLEDYAYKTFGKDLTKAQLNKMDLSKI